MKLRTLFFAALAAVFAFVSCQEAKEDLGTPKITISTENMTFEIAGGEQELILNATRDWTVEMDEAAAQWLAISPNEGAASSKDQKITVTALENPGTTRSAVVNFNIGKMGSRTLTVSQTGPGGNAEPDVPVVSGEGTEANPYLASEAMIVASEMDQSATRDDVYVKGVVAQIKDPFSEQYGNISYYITDDGKAIDTKQMFLVYRGKYFNGDKFTSADQLKVGDEVIVAGTLQNYYGNTPELIAGNRIVKLNGETSGSAGGGGNEGGNDGSDTPAPEAPAVPSAFTSVKNFISASVGDEWYKLKGQIINIEKETFGNFTIKDDAGDELYVYGLTKEYAASNDQSFSSIGLKVGYYVTFVAKRGEYGGNPQATGAFYVSHEVGELDLGANVNFTKLTAAPSDWTGSYLIYLSDNKAHAAVSGKDLAAVSDELSDNGGVISTSETYAVKVASAGDGKWSIQLPNGKYLGAGHNSCMSSDTPVALSMEWTASGVKIYGEATNGGKTNTYYLYHNTSNGGSYIRFYVDKSSDERYALPVLYKK